jgi:hypothetical protein
MLFPRCGCHLTIEDLTIQQNEITTVRLPLKLEFVLATIDKGNDAVPRNIKLNIEVPIFDFGP